MKTLHHSNTNSTPLGIMVLLAVLGIVLIVAMSGCAAIDSVRNMFGQQPESTGSEQQAPQSNSEKNGDGDYGQAQPVEYVATRNLPSGGASMPLPWYRSKLSSPEQELYDIIEDGVRSMSEDISVPDTDPDTLSECYQAVLDDNPDIFWVSLSYTYRSNGFGTVTDLLPKYDDGADAVRKRASELDDAVTMALAGAPSGGSDYDKCVYAFTWLCDNVSYDEAAPSNQDVESVFFGGSSSCAGYSKAFQLMAGKLGVPSIYVTGTATSDDGTVEHAWNAVCLNGTNAYVDVTWGDRDGEAPVDYGWLGLSREDIEKSHSPASPQLLPKAAERTYELWAIAGGYFPAYEEDAVVDRLASGVAAKEACTSIRFGSEDEMHRAFSEATQSPRLASKIAAMHPDVFPEAVTKGVYAVYEEPKLEALVFVWTY